MRREENRWYTKTGKAKRIPASMEKFRKFAITHKALMVPELRILELTKQVRLAYPQLGLAEALNLLVYIIGMFNNGDNGGVFQEYRYSLGKLVAKGL